MGRNHRGLLVKFIVTVFVKMKVKIDCGEDTGPPLGTGLLLASGAAPAAWPSASAVPLERKPIGETVVIGVSAAGRKGRVAACIPNIRISSP